MHKITKELKKKKKKKTKKSKRAEEELFKPEELENYRKEHQGTSEEPASQNEEWKKFLALTSGVDDILKKTQGDLDRIKSTSFFQRKPTETEVIESEKQKISEEKQEAFQKERNIPQLASSQIGIVEVSDSEFEENEDDDSVFDTAYIDVIASGELKLAYIPESPTEKQDENDPFDTSIAERAILGPEVERKGKKLVPIGAAVEVLTGRVHLPTCATKRPSTRRRIVKERDLILGSFDDSSSVELFSCKVAQDDEVKRTLLDDDPIPLLVQSSNGIRPVSQPLINSTPGNKTDSNKETGQEFDTTKPEDDDDLEFEALAAESLSKSGKIIQTLPPTTSSVAVETLKWSAFEAPTRNDYISDDPFDTGFADNITSEFKTEKLNSKFIPPTNVFSVSINTDKDLQPSESRISEEELNIIQPIHRDLLGVSNVDLSICTGISVQPTRIISTTTNISTNEVDVLENNFFSKDLLSDDNDFDPRAEEIRRERTVSRPDVLNISASRTVSFDIPTPESDLLKTDSSRVIKPLTPFYIRKNSVSESVALQSLDYPFDTSFAANVAPGKAELRLIESELFDPNIELSSNLVDKNFDPRNQEKAKIDKFIDSIKEAPKNKLTKLSESIDLLVIENDIPVKVLTPKDSAGHSFEDILYSDPFDTSIACNILPGKSELKLLETEFIHSESENIQKI